MKNFMLAFVMTLVAASVPHAGQPSETQYAEFSDRVSVTVDHVIYLDDRDGPFAARDFWFDLTQAAEPAAAAVTVTINRAGGSYSAHGRKMKLGARHLTGKTFSLSLEDGGRRLGPIEASMAPIIDVGPPVEDGLSISALLADTLPILPERELAVGTSWTTERDIRSLEGWGWGNGRLTSRHRVTSIEGEGEHPVVTVTTEAEANLGPRTDERAFTGEIQRTLTWTFDAGAGRLLSMSMDQESSGSCLLPQGVVEYRQQTQIELTPVDARAAS